MSAARHRDPEAGALDGIALPTATFDLDPAGASIETGDRARAEAPVLGPPEDPAPVDPVAAAPVLEQPQADPARRPAPSRAFVLFAALGSIAAHAAVIVALGQLASPPGLEGSEAPVAVVMVEESIARAASAPAAAEPAVEAPVETAEPVETMAPAEPAPAPEVAEAAALDPAPVVEPEAPVEPAVPVEPEAAGEPEPVEAVETPPAEVAQAAPVEPQQDLPREAAPPAVAEPVAEAPEPVADIETPSVLAAVPVEPLAAEPPPAEPQRAEAVDAPPAEIVEESFEDLPVALALAPTPRPDLAAERRAAEREQARREERERQAAAPRRETRPQAEPPREQAQPQRRRQAPAQAAAPSRQAAAAASPGEQDRYARSLLRHVERHKRYPREAERARISGAARLAVTIDRSGGLAGARLAGSSGHAVLDEEAIAVARRAAPYPRPPEGVGGSTFSFTVTLRFGR